MGVAIDREENSGALAKDAKLAIIASAGAVTDKNP
jgi:hypothetical protein